MKTTALHGICMYSYLQESLLTSSCKRLDIGTACYMVGERWTE